MLLVSRPVKGNRRRTPRPAYTAPQRTISVSVGGQALPEAWWTSGRGGRCGPCNARRAAATNVDVRRARFTVAITCWTSAVCTPPMHHRRQTRGKARDTVAPEAVSPPMTGMARRIPQHLSRDVDALRHAAAGRWCVVRRRRRPDAWPGWRLCWPGCRSSGSTRPGAPSPLPRPGGLFLERSTMLMASAYTHGSCRPTRCATPQRLTPT